MQYMRIYAIYEKYMQYISGVSFFRLYFKSFKLLYAPKEILIVEEISEFKIFVYVILNVC